MTGDVLVEINQEMYSRVIASLRDVSKSEESVFKSAVNNTAKQAQKILTEQAKRVYAGEASRGIRERSSVKKGRVGNLGATIFFQSEQHDITKFRVNANGRTPTKTIYVGGKRKKFPIRAAQLKGGRMKALKGKTGMAFAVQFKNGKIAVVNRTGERTSTGKDKLKTVMGSSDRAMIRNEKVYGRKETEIAEYLNDQVQKSLEKALGGLK